MAKSTHDLGHWFRVVLLALPNLFCLLMYVSEWIATRPARERMALREAAEHQK